FRAAMTSLDSEALFAYAPNRERTRSRLWPLVQEHPGRSEPVAKHGKARRKKRLLHLHEDLAAVRQERIHPICVLVAVEPQAQIRAAHGFRTEDVGAHQHAPANLDASVQDLLPPGRRKTALTRPVAMPIHHRDPAAEMLFVEPEGLLAVALVVEIDVEFHGVLFP